MGSPAGGQPAGASPAGLYSETTSNFGMANFSRQFSGLNAGGQPGAANAAYKRFAGSFIGMGRFRAPGHDRLFLAVLPKGRRCFASPDATHFFHGEKVGKTPLRGFTPKNPGFCALGSWRGLFYKPYR